MRFFRQFTWASAILAALPCAASAAEAGERLECVPQGTRAGEQVRLPGVGRVTVVRISPVNTHCGANGPTLTSITATVVPDDASPTPEARAEAPAPPGVRQGRGHRSFGSAFLVSTTYAVTNNHVVEGCRDVVVRQDDVETAAIKVASAASSDLALLRVQGAIGGATSPVRGTALLGEDVMAAGHPLAGLLSNDLTVTAGQVNSLAGIGNDPSRLQFSAPIQPGNSGGPLLDRSGAVVGVVASKLNTLKVGQITGDISQNINFAIKPEVLRLFLDTNRIQYQKGVERPAPGAQMTNFDLAEVARRITLQVICR